MGIVLAGQVWPRGTPVPGSASSEAHASLFRLLTVQVGKTPCSSELRQEYLVSGWQQRKDCFEEKCFFSSNLVSNFHPEYAQYVSRAMFCR